ncbi:MAG: hypothetical protein KDD64_12790 [Bdellovibrionales bacterium]|nr:hypothetical protein [Bdellovibrionales bacterium]
MISFVARGTVIALSLIFAIASSVVAEELMGEFDLRKTTTSPVNDEIRYRTPNERQESGAMWDLGRYGSLSLLIDYEFSYERYRRELEDGKRLDRSDGGDIQFGYFIEPLSWLEGEFVYVFESATGKGLVDEAVAQVSLNKFTFEFGKMNPPFGEFYSYFVSGPVLEFGEIVETSLVVSYEYLSGFEFVLFSYDGDAKKEGEGGHEIDWGVALIGEPSKVLEFRFSAVSDVADAKDSPLAEEDRPYRTRVPGVSGSLALSLDDFDISLEYLGAAKKFDALESSVNRPQAWNFEIAKSLGERLLAAWRVETSRELEDAPHWQTGVTVSYQVYDEILLSADYLHGWFKEGTASDFESNERDLVVVQISLGL